MCGAPCLGGVNFQPLLLEEVANEIDFLDLLLNFLKEDAEEEGLVEEELEVSLVGRVDVLESE